jgi:hypothetical protein
MSYLDNIAAQIRQHISPELLPDRDVDQLFRFYAVLALTLGADVGPADVHDAWVAWMTPLEPDHPSLIPFADLSPDTQKQDDPFVRAIRQVAHDRDFGRH